MLLSIDLAAVARVFSAMLNLDAARTAQLEILVEKIGSPLPPSTCLFAAEFCTVSALAGAWEDAQQYALQELASGLETPYLYRGLSRCFVTKALIRAGETERAAEDVDRYEVRYGHICRHRISCLRSLAVLTEHRGETCEAILRLQKARTLAREIGLPGEV